MRKSIVCIAATTVALALTSCNKPSAPAEAPANQSTYSASTQEAGTTTGEAAAAKEREGRTGSSNVHADPSKVDTNEGTKRETPTPSPTPGKP